MTKDFIYKKGGYAGTADGSNEIIKWRGAEAQINEFVKMQARFGVKQLAFTPGADCEIRLNNGSPIAVKAGVKTTFENLSIYSVKVTSGTEYFVDYSY